MRRVAGFSRRAVVVKAALVALIGAILPFEPAQQSRQIDSRFTNHIRPESNPWLISLLVKYYVLRGSAI